jgi:hypothetical protein
MNGMPAAIGDTINDPEIVAGETYTFTTGQVGLEGTYYLAVTLYCEGGGAGQVPKAGVDWVAGNGSPLVLGPGTGTVDAGQMTLFLAPE